MIKQVNIPVVLASASPRRKALLQELGLKFEVIPAPIDETHLANESALEYVRRLALEKGRVIAQQYPKSMIISSDTIVVFNHNILGKPTCEADAERMLKALSGRSHEVITAFSIQCIDHDIELLEHEITEVHFRKLSKDDIDEYILSGSPMDKAGAYGIQDLDAYLVDRINGSYQNVMGFPLAKFALVWNGLVAGI